MDKQALPPLNVTELGPFKFNMPPAGAPLVEVMFGPGAKVVHPCAAFARSAGFESWALAVEAMRAGQNLQGRAPHMGKSTLSVDLFNKEVASAGLLAEYSDFGLVVVGLPNQFK